MYVFKKKKDTLRLKNGEKEEPHKHTHAPSLYILMFF